MGRISVLILEKQSSAGAHLARRLQHLGYDVVGVAATPEEALRSAGERVPDLLLSNTALSRAHDGIEAARAVRSRLHVPLVYVTRQDDQQTLERAAATHPEGYLLRPLREPELTITMQLALQRYQDVDALKQRVVTLEQVVAQVRDVTDGERLVVRQVPLSEIKHPCGPVASASAHPLQPLTPREQQILDLFLAGFTTVTIGARLQISTHTVRNHLKNISHKYEVGSQSDLREIFAPDREP